MSRELKIAVAVIWVLLIILATLIQRNTNAVIAGNEIGKRQEYERVLLGCNTSGALGSVDPEVRHLCIVVLPQLHIEAYGS
jgi:hypothetical protein